jgi:hypothetical protein
MYFRLRSNLNRNSGLMKPRDNVDETLIDGTLIDSSALTLPWPFIVKHGRPDPLQLADFYSSAKLMSNRLIETLKSAGVDNLQLFDAQITNERTGERIDGYKVVNILGLVAAADPAASKSRPLADVQFFEKLAIDESSARGQLMFRLAESLNDIIVAERVARQITAGKFVDVVVEPLESGPPGSA